MVQQLGSKFKNALDKKAPIKTKVTMVRKMVPWLKPECDKDSKKLYKLALSLMGAMKENLLPECDTKQDLANQLAEFFINKIQNMRDKLDSLQVYDQKDSSPPKLSKFEPLMEEEVRQIIKAMPSKCCDLDVIPTSLLKEALELLLPTLTKLVNLSLEEGVFAEEWKWPW